MTTPGKVGQVATVRIRHQIYSNIEASWTEESRLGRLCQYVQAGLPSNDHSRLALLDGGEDCTLTNATLSACSGRTLLDADVSILTKAFAPAILHLPVLLPIIFTIANCKNAMVELGSARIVGENATGVVLEDSLVGFDGNRDRLLCNSSFQCALGLIHVGVRSHIANGDNQCWWRGSGA